MRLGKREGLTVGDRVGRELVGDVEGSCDGARELEGLHVGCAEGGAVEINVGLKEGAKEGNTEGSTEGEEVDDGLLVCDGEGKRDGVIVGETVGLTLGMLVGLFVGEIVG